MSQQENMEAVNRYMRSTPIVNNIAFPIKDDFIRWWDNLSWWSINVDSGAWDEARTRRNKFQLANTKSEQERAGVVNVITKGIESEEMEGKTRPTTLSTGEVGSQVKKPSSTLTAGAKTVTGATIRVGSTGPDVVKWQQIIGVKADGKFGPGTEAATKAWQALHSLTPDGVVGPKTWAAASPPAPSSDFAKPGEVITPSKPTLSLNSKGPDVVQWQGIVGVKPATGFFGQMTVDFTKKWQSSKGLPATGIVDAKTWEVALKSGGTFAPTVQPTPSFAPTPTPTFKPTSSPGTKAAPKTAPKAAPKVAAKAKTAALATAGMFDFSKWPVWAQVTAGATAVAGLAYAFMGGKVRRFG